MSGEAPDKLPGALCRDGSDGVLPQVSGLDGGGHCRIGEITAASITTNLEAAEGSFPGRGGASCRYHFPARYDERSLADRG